MTPYKALKELAIMAADATPEAPKGAFFLGGWEYALDFALRFPDAAEKLLASIDLEVHEGVEHASKRDGLFSFILNAMAQEVKH